MKKVDTNRAEQQTSINTGYFICDKRGRFLSVNELLVSLTGYSEEEILSLSIADIMPEEEEPEFFSLLYQEENIGKTLTFSFHLINKLGERRPVEFKIRLITDDNERVIGFRGHVVLLPAKSRKERPDESGNQTRLVEDLVDIIYMGYSEPLANVLKRVAESIGQNFGFKRSTIALLDKRKKTFVKHAMVGYRDDTSVTERRSIEAPQDVISRIFADHKKIKVIRHSQPQESSGGQVSGLALAQEHQIEKWHDRDLLLLNLTNHSGKTFGYVSLESPLEERKPDQTTFDNLEMFSSLLSMAIENYYRFSSLEKRNRRLKQVLVNSNIFKLYLSLSELLKEVVWSVKFTVDFNVVSLILISKKSGMLETKAVACDEKIKVLQLGELCFDLKAFSDMLRDEYRQGKSYLVTEEESVLQHFKQIYYGARLNHPQNSSWPIWALLLVPIKSREGKIIGFLAADDPGDRQMPNRDTMKIMEIMANQIAIAIDNRVMYVQSREQIKESVNNRPPGPDTESYRTASESSGINYDREREEHYSSGGLRKLVEKFLR